MRGGAGADDGASAAGQARLVFVAAALGLLVYEATKTALLPHLTLWQANAVTIAFGSVVAYVAARRCAESPRPSGGSGRRG